MATKKVYTNTIAQIAGKVSTALISIFLIKILTNYLDVEGYGLYSKIYNYLSIFAVIADLGLYTITVREISDNQKDHEMVQKIVGNILTLRTLFGVAIIFLSLAIAFFLPGYNSKAALAGIAIAGVFTLFGLVNSSVMSLLQAYLKTEFSFISTTAGKITTFVMVSLVALVFLPKSLFAGNPDLKLYGFMAMMAAGLLGNVVMTLMLYIYARRVEKIVFRFDSEYMKHILTISLPYGIALFLNVIYFKVDVILLSVMEPRALADTSIALYSVPMKIVEVGMMFGTLFLNSMLPIFTASIKEKESERLLEFVSKAYKTLLVFGVGTAAFLYVNASEVISFIASKEYLQSDKTVYTSLEAMQIVVFIFFFYFLSSLFTYLLIANNEQKKLLKINATITTINLIGNILLIPYLSFVGSAIVTLISQVILLIFTSKASRHIINFNFLPKFTISIVALASLTSLLDYYILSNTTFPLFITLVLSAITFGVVYLWGVFLSLKSPLSR